MGHDAGLGYPLERRAMADNKRGTQDKDQARAQSTNLGA